MGSYNTDTKLKSPTIEELFPKILSSKPSTHSHINTPPTTQKQRTFTPAARVGSPNTQLCKGTSVSTGRPCKRSVVSNNSNNYCYQHKDQITGKNIFGIPTTPKKNNLSRDEINYLGNDIEDVIDLSNDVTKASSSHSQNDRQEKLSEIENQMNTLSLDNPKKYQDSKIKDSETGSTSITINLNNLKVQITEELSKKSTMVSISSEDNPSSFDSREQTPPPIIDRAVQTDNKLPLQSRLPIESPACVDDSFLETTNKELFQTPTLVTPSNELILAPLLSISPSQPKSPLDSLYEMFNPRQKITPKLDREPPSTPTPTRTRVSSSYTSCVAITDTTPNRSYNLTDDHYSPSKSGKIHKKKFIEPVEEELEKAVFVPGRARLTWLRFGEWIKPDLSPDTRRLLRSEMEKPISDKDEPGFIYAYRLLEGPDSEKDSQYTLYKVGRTTNVHRRLYQWSKQCGYTPELIDRFPNANKLSSQEVFLIGKEEGEKCKYTHRAERLIHIELGARFKADIEKCKNCGNLHREWFKVTVDSSDNKSHNRGMMHRWDDVRKVIVHWIFYVEKVYGVG